MLLTLQDIKKNSSCSVENNWSPLLDRCFARGLFWRHLILNCLFVHSLGQWSLRLNYHKRLWTNWTYYVATIWIQSGWKFQQSSHLHECTIFEVNHTEVAGCFGEQAQIEQKWIKLYLLYGFRYGLVCLRKTFFVKMNFLFEKQKVDLKMTDYFVIACSVQIQF